MSAHTAGGRGRLGFEAPQDPFMLDVSVTFKMVTKNFYKSIKDDRILFNQNIYVPDPIENQCRCIKKTCYTILEFY